MHLQTLPLRDLHPAPYNPRLKLRPGDPRYRKLRRSVERFGLVEPLVWNRRTGHLVGGHQRYQILCDLGHTEAPVSVVDLPSGVLHTIGFVIALTIVAFLHMVVGEMVPKFVGLRAASCRKRRRER